MTRKGTLKVGRAALLVALLGLFAAACGSSSSSNSASASAASGNAGGTAATKATGAPLIIYDVTDASVDSTQAAVPPAMQAAANYVNNTLGGVNGRPIQIVNCDPKAVPAATATCFNKAVQARALAESGISLIGGACCLQIMDTAKIPMFQIPVLPTEYNNPWVFSFAGNQATIDTAQAKFVLQKGAKNIAAVALDLPTTREETAAFQNAATGAKVTRIFYKFGNVDFTPQINQILQLKPDFVVLWGAEPDELRIDEGLKQAGFPLDHVLAGNEAVDYANFYKPGGSNVVGMYQVHFFRDWSDTSNPDVAIYRKAMAAAGAAPGSDYAQWAFANVIMIARAAAALKDPTPAALADYFKTHTNLPIFMGGTTSAPSAPLGAILNTSVPIVQWDGSTLKTVTTLTG
jgi:branched-chain amino acid transport system substrate-binding protein